MDRNTVRLLFALCVGATMAPSVAVAQPTKADEAMLKKVSARLLAVCDPVPGYEWPPNFAFEGDHINAYAALIRKNDKLYPIIRVTPDMMKKVIQGDENRLALILGHELGHIVFKHNLPQEAKDKTPFLKTVFDRDKEVQADQFGVEIMVKAGFSFDRGKQCILRMKEMGLEYSSFEGLGKDHPSWDARLTRIDKDQAKTWKAMSAFRNGAVFLAAENYGAAETCFDRVVADFPACYEGWVNLGFACLMRYCDKLDAQDLRDYALGQILTGGFYQRVESIPVRGKDAKLWWKAVGALNKALALKPDLALAKANLGLAYLVHPDGKDVGEAAKLMQEATDLAAKDKTLDRNAHAALLVNLGVANLAGGKPDKGLAQLEEGEKLALAGAPANPRQNATLTAALLYNRALNLAASKDRKSQEQALGLFEKYLKTASPLSLWWPLAYERYEALSKALGQTVKAKDTFKKDQPEPLRLVAGVKLKSGPEVMLTEDLADVVKKIGKGRETVAVNNTNLKRLHYDKEGVDLLVTDEVIAICLVGKDAPPLALRGKGATAQMVELRIGMTAKEVEAILGEDYQPCELTVAETYYRFYRDQGVAVRLVKGQVVEIVVVQIAKR